MRRFKKIKRNVVAINIFFILVFVFLTGHLFLSFNLTEASSSGIEFSSDVILDLDGLETTLYIAEGSSAEELTVSGSTLSVTGVPASGFFHIKTDSHTVLKIEPSTNSIGFSISSENITSLGYIQEWSIDSVGEIGFIVGVLLEETYYSVRKNGTEIDESPFLSSDTLEGWYKISFTESGEGVYAVGLFYDPQDARLRGWAWSDNIGWICFSSQDDPQSGDVNYGINISEEGVLFGHAWSDNIGWISFNENDLVGCPEGTCRAEIDNNNNLIGWAKALSNDEWVSFSGDIPGGEDYGVTLDVSDFYGWAWGDTTLGWISFNCQNEEECGVSNYKVWVVGWGKREPTIRTNPATHIDPEEEKAVLSGTLLDMGGHNEATVWFEWGTSEEMNNSTPELEREIKTERGSFSEEISAVLGETYYFRAVAENGEGVSYGNMMRFTVTEKSGMIIISYGDFWRGINVFEDGRIEIVK